MRQTQTIGEKEKKITSRRVRVRKNAIHYVVTSRAPCTPLIKNQYPPQQAACWNENFTHHLPDPWYDADAGPG